MTPREKNNAQFLINSLNKEFGTDFLIDESFSEQSSHVDVSAASKKLGKSILIQNVAYRDGTFYAYATSSTHPDIKFTAVLGTAMTDSERRESILKGIKDKEGKYQPSLLKDIILLVEVTIPIIRPEELSKLFPNGVETNFQAIYFVALPVVMADRDDKYAQTGYVYPLKSLIF